MIPPPDLQPLLSDLRRELNRLNTLNCVMHQYQGDFDADKVLAQRTTEGAVKLYLDQLRDHVKPLFMELGERLVMAGELDPGEDERDYEVLAMRWYAKEYQTGVVW